MHRFGVGDWVEVMEVLVVAPDMKQGTILRVLPHSARRNGNEYEVRFGLNTALHHETELRAISTAFDQD
jgi:hypothetical protein